MTMTKRGERRIHRYLTDRTHSAPHHVVVAKSHFDQTYSFPSSKSCQHGLGSPTSDGVINRSISCIYSALWFFSFLSAHIPTSQISNTHITQTNCQPTPLTMAKRSKKAPSRQHILDCAFAASPHATSEGPWTHHYENTNGRTSTTQYWLPGQDPPTGDMPRHPKKGYKAGRLGSTWYERRIPHGAFPGVS